MFIEVRRKSNYFEYEVRDDKEYLLHYLEMELETISLQAPLVVYIHANPDDRIGFRIKMVKLFKKINKLTKYEVYIADSSTIERIKENENLNRSL